MNDTSAPDPDGRGEALAQVLEGLDGANAALMDSIILRHLPAPAQSSVMERLRPRRYDTGDFIFSRSDPDHAGVHTVIHGQANVYARGPKNSGEPLAVVHPGELLGEYRAIMGSAGHVDVKAAVPTVTAMLERQDFLDLVHTHPALSNHLLRRVIDTVRHLSGRVDGFHVLDRELGKMSRELLRSSI